MPNILIMKKDKGVKGVTQDKPVSVGNVAKWQTFSSTTTKDRIETVRVSQVDRVGVNYWVSVRQLNPAAVGVPDFQNWEISEAGWFVASVKISYKNDIIDIVPI